MCFVTFNRYMVDHQNSSKDEGPSKRPTKRSTWLRQLLLKWVSSEKTLIVIDIVIGVAIGLYADIFNSYLGVLAHDRTSILTLSLDHVFEVD